MQHLAGVCARGENRVIAALVRVAKPSALLGIAMHLTDEAVDVDDQPLVTRPGSRSPCANDALIEHAVKLTDMPERERAQKRPERRGRRDPMTKHSGGLARAQHVAVLDAIRSQRHRRDQAHHLASRIRRAATIAQSHRLVHEPLEPKPTGKDRRKHHASVRDYSLVIEDHDRRVVHHEGDLLSRAATAAICRYQALLGRSLHPRARMERWIEAKSGSLRVTCSEFAVRRRPRSFGLET